MNRKATVGVCAMIVGAAVVFVAESVSASPRVAVRSASWELDFKFHGSKQRKRP